MRANSALVFLLLIYSLVPGTTVSSTYGQGFTDIEVMTTPEPLVRYTSGKVIYVEGLVGGRWVGRYWTADGRLDFPQELRADDAFELQIADQWLAKGWRWVRASEAPRTEKGARHFVVELSSTLCPITLKVHTLLDGTPVLVRWLEITNTSNKPTPLSAVYPWASRLWRTGHYRQPLRKSTDAVFTLGSLTDITGPGWESGREEWLRWAPLTNQTIRLERRAGRGHNDPFFLVRNESEGEYFIGHLAWTANWDAEFKSTQDGAGGEANLWFKVGPWASTPQRVISAGETIQTPAVHLGHVEGDLDAAVQAMHDHLRRSVLLSRKPERSYLVQFSVPGDRGYYRGKELTEANLLKQIDVAAAVGAELFIVDAWWWDVSGDWVPSPTRFPRGLEPLIEYTHKKGMLFGLYAEVEGGRGKMNESRVGKEHPDWFGPSQVLNLSKPEVAALVESETVGLIDRYKLDLYRVDFNAPPMGEFGQTPRQGYQENDYWRYCEALYGMYERIHARYPDVILQQAGGRNDLGIASVFHETYSTEGPLSPVLRYYSRQTLNLPPEILVFGIGDERERGHLDSHLRAVFTLSTPWILTGVAPSADKLSPEHRERYLHYANLYKKFIRPVFPTAKMYHHAPVTATGGVTSSGWFAMEYASPDRAKGWATIVRIGEDESDTFLFKPRGLDPGKTYRVTFDSKDSTATVSGLQLVRDGLPIRLEAITSSELLLFEAQ